MAKINTQKNTSGRSAALDTETTLADRLKETTKKKVEKKETYFKLGDSPDKEGVLEFDLISYREKGEETRYISIKFSGVDVRGIDENNSESVPVTQEAFVAINEEEVFQSFKAFIINLNWND